MKKNVRTFFTAKNITYFAALAALIIVLQIFASVFKIGATPISLVLVPVILGGMILGVGAGAALGAVFGITVIIYALCGMDVFTLYLLGENPVFTVGLCIVKGAAAGAVSALVYRLVAVRNRYAAVFVSAAIAPIVNTGLFIVGALMMSGVVKSALSSITGSDLAGVSPFYIVIVLCVGINFFVELAVDMVCAPALYSVNRVIAKRFSKKKISQGS